MTDTRAGADAADQRREAAIEVAIRTGLLKRCPAHGEVFDPGQHDFQGASMVATYLVNQSHPVVATFGGDRAALMALLKTICQGYGPGCPNCAGRHRSPLDEPDHSANLKTNHDPEDAR
jgi:hypothetical protein